MKNQLAQNRVEIELNHWQSREARFTKLFSFSLSTNKALLKEKLRYYERVTAKYKGTNDPDERFALHLLRQESRRMEKQLYPNLFLRMLRRLLIIPIREQAIIHKDKKNAEQNSRSLQVQLQQVGFTIVPSKLDELLKQGQNQFTIPISYYINENERMDHILSFSKDQIGIFQFTGFQTKLYDETQPASRKQHYFELKEGIHVNCAYHLLKGRAIQKEDRWIQIDFNDKDAKGSYRMKEFHSSFGYDLQKVLQDLPIKELQERDTTYQLLDRLKQGSREAVSFLRNGKEQRYYIEANPQFKSVNIYDSHSRKITLSAALGGKTMEALKVSHTVNEQQVQSKRNQIRIH
ncbi:hypothetical protein [Emticicia sp. TH156]|uniref:hypothetical protein n=1 Tax=Emticicia sp. TH156 TaxID=2067454 RepID=UPI000C782D10|nr:hypothetical protein [Emticicia sp. TH156]PLK44998.1 hypothetical protein C0V77_07065 [Emticicia sp. TH156]